MKMYKRENKLSIWYLLLIPIAIVLAGTTEVKAQTPPAPPAGVPGPPGPPPSPDQLFKKINPFGKSKHKKAKRWSNNDSALPTPPGAPPADPLHLFKKKG